jgi:cytochrome c-type biogenesis protein CcmF
MLALGITASSFYDVQKDVVMRPGDSEVLGKYTFKYLEVSEKSYPDRVEEIAKFEVWSGNKNIGYMYPYRAFYPEFQIAATKGAIHSTILEDFYLVPSEFKEDGQAVFRVLVNPLVSWMWAAGPVLILGTLIALSPKNRTQRKRLQLPNVNVDQNPLRISE